MLWAFSEAGVEQGIQLTAGELAQRSGMPLGVFAEATQPDDPVPLWVDVSGSILVYWDVGAAGRRWGAHQDAIVVAASELLPNRARVRGNARYAEPASLKVC